MTKPTILQFISLFYIYLSCPLFCRCTMWAFFNQMHSTWHNWSTVGKKKDYITDVQKKAEASPKSHDTTDLAKMWVWVVPHGSLSHYYHPQYKTSGMCKTESIHWKWSIMCTYIYMSTSQEKKVCYSIHMAHDIMGLSDRFHWPFELWITNLTHGYEIIHLKSTSYILAKNKRICDNNMTFNKHSKWLSGTERFIMIIKPEDLFMLALLCLKTYEITPPW